MIPTYVLCDSEPNKNVDAENLAIMGCRTRVYENLNGPKTSIGRGNLSFTTINLVKIALECKDPNKYLENLARYVKLAIKQLKERYDFLLNQKVSKGERLFML